MPGCIYHAGHQKPCTECVRLGRGEFAHCPKKLNLSRLPRTSWWRLFIDIDFHGQQDPANYFDRDQSPGYNDAMTAMFFRLLHPGGALFSKSLKTQDYEDIHYALTKSMGAAVLWASNTTFRAFPVDALDAPSYRGATWADYLASVQELVTEGNVLVDQLPTGGLPAIIRASGVITASYTETQARDRIKAILDHYYTERETIGSDTAPNAPSAEALLVRLIAKTIRALHVGHFFRDGNGRLNCYVMLNKLLVDNGLSPTILPHGPSVFGGLKPLKLLAIDIWQGMFAFEARVKAGG